ncbi:formylglycine-generating enzyme family protein [Aliikangiella coralliicola]|uniref:SUMF1/EgtB/PvdOfamily nonheme iron enzyme n=1 Tax=Aliikangiella coralliicola TaxID=2592383 RepID=A0A545UJW8_9GAMM|nr:SUMF1/EgtB/PvdO family nonheme iron enzyme [Aliikangiella coralliicola]TQV89751.1 SUMF1/EgtB/PvdOfamily nonheme iron enzyme [Aliikangiella coralliicola]
MRDFTSKLLVSVFASTIVTTFSINAAQPEFIEPPTVSIPAGEFYMGSDRGEKNEQPVRKVSISAFQMGKYEVTVAEFKKFIEATGYKMPDNCYQYVLGGPRTELASWDSTVYKFSDYHPVVCLPQQAAVDYAKWLSKETGKNYRLPTEAEWEYTLRAGTNSRHFFGEEQDSSKACQFANISDWYAADMSAKIFPGAHVRDIEQCSDNEATLAIVGLYEPNPFGVYDMVGNIMEYLADCYVDNYENAPVDGSAVSKENCDTYVVRGGSWHWFPWHSSERGRISNDFLGALEGFRLVLDTDGKSLPPQKGSAAFSKNLAIAQQKAKKKHKENPAYPNKPQGLKVIESSPAKVVLSWQKNHQPFLSGYKVYRQDLLTNQKVSISKLIKESYFVDTSPLAHNARYSVVALNGKTESVYSDPVDSGQTTIHTLPTKIQGEAFSYSVGNEVKFSVLEPENDKIINSMDDKPSTYLIKVARGGKFKIDARVFYPGRGENFEIWLGDMKIAAPKLDGERGWKTINNINIDLPKGTFALTIKGGETMFAVNWLDIKKI